MNDSPNDDVRHTLMHDRQVLQQLGYRQELLRGMGAFSSFAISFSIICILAGGITSFHIAFSAGGGGAIGIGWPVCVAFSLCVALAMAQIASAYPTAGALYHWSAILGGRGWGWITALLNLVGNCAVISAIDVGLYLFVVHAVAPALGIQVAGLTPWHQVAALVVIVGVQAAVNDRGIRLTSLLTDSSGWLILAVATVLTVGLLLSAPHLEWTRLVTFTNNSGAPGGNVWPRQQSMLGLFMLALLWPAYTLTGFDASAHTAEETSDAERNVPKSVVRAVLWSGIAGYVMVCAIVLVMPDARAGALQADNVVLWTMERVLPLPIRIICLVGIAIAQFLCGLATVTSTSRLVYAFARDGGLPWSHQLAKVDAIRFVPRRAIWFVAIVAISFTLYTPVYSTLTAVSVIFLYISYVLPVALGLAAYGTRWTHFGPWHLGRWYRPIATIALLGCVVILIVSVQPPNQLALWFTLGAGTVAALLWFTVESRRFRGPPNIS